MNRQLFLQLLEHPDSASETEHIALKKFTEDFPYCQTGRLLFVKHLHSQKSVHYPEQLKIAAAYAADRKALYNLIHSPAPGLPAIPMPSQEQAGLAPLQSREEHLLTESVEDEAPMPQSPIVDERIESVEENFGQPSAEIIPEKIVEEPVSQADIIEKRLQEIAALKASPLPAITEPEQGQAGLTPLQRREEALTEGVEEKISGPEKAEQLKSEPVFFKEEKPTPAPEIIQPKEDNKGEDRKAGKHSFTEWLKTVKIEPTAEPGEPKSAPPSPSADEIIDRFIETEPRIVPSKAEFYNPVKMAKQSLEEHDDLVSETLAGIFAEQGNLPRAIEMYRKLMLSNPEKSSFFAALIEKLTQQLNEGK